MPRGKARGAEWFIGIQPMPANITGEGASYQPLGLMIMDSADESILGLETSHPDEGLSMAADALRRIMREPLVGKPRAPRRILTASGALAESLSRDLFDTHPDIEIMVARTPALDEAFQAMGAMIAKRHDAPTWLGGGASVDAVAHYFDAMAELHAARPWQYVPGTAAPMRISCKALDIDDEVLSIIGQLGESFGMIRFESDAACSRYQEFVCDPDRFDPGALPTGHVAYTFDRMEDTAPQIVEEVERHGWNIADSNAWPSIMLLDAELGMRSPTDHDLLIGEGLARAVTLAITEELEALDEAFATGNGLALELGVVTAARLMVVHLSVPSHDDHADPLRGEPLGAEVPEDPRNLTELIDALHALQTEASGTGELDLDASESLTRDILTRFAGSPEAEPFEFPLEGAGMLLQFAAMDRGRTLPGLTDSELEILLFEVIPTKVSAGPEIARELIETARAFFVWLKREATFAQAADLIELLGEDAVGELEALLDDPVNFGPAKRMAMQAMAQGVDLSDAAAMREFMGSRLGPMAGDDPNDPLFDPYGYDSGVLGPATDTTLTPEQRGARQKKRKKDRKSARKARKKNR